MLHRAGHPDAAPAGCLERVAGTHAGPWLLPRTFRTGEARRLADGVELDHPLFPVVWPA